MPRRRHDERRYRLVLRPAAAVLVLCIAFGAVVDLPCGGSSAPGAAGEPSQGEADSRAPNKGEDCPSTCYCMQTALCPGDPPVLSLQDLVSHLLKPAVSKADGRQRPPYHPPRSSA